MEADSLESLVNFFESLLAEVGNAQQIFARAMEQIVDREDAFFFEAVGRADGEADFRSAHFQTILQSLIGQFGLVQRNAGLHRVSLPGFQIVVSNMKSASPSLWRRV